MSYSRQFVMGNMPYGNLFSHIRIFLLPYGNSVFLIPLLLIICIICFIWAFCLGICQRVSASVYVWLVIFNDLMFLQLSYFIASDMCAVCVYCMCVLCACMLCIYMLCVCICFVRACALCMCCPCLCVSVCFVCLRVLYVFFSVCVV